MSESSKYNLNDKIHSENSGFSLDQIIYYLKKTHWFVIGVVICLLLAQLKLKYASPLFKSTAKVLFKNDESAGLFNEASAFQDFGYGYNYSPIENEIETLKSRSLMKKVVKDLKLNVVFYDNNGLVPKEKYGKCPLKITFLNGDSTIYNRGARFELKIRDNNRFIIENDKDNYRYEGAFGKPFDTKVGEIVLTPSGKKTSLVSGKKYILYIYELEGVVDQYAGNIQIERGNEFSNVLEISLVDNSIDKATDIVNTIIFRHQDEAINDHNQVAKNSILFINDRISIISKELADVEGNAQVFKTNNNIIDVGTEATIFMETQQEIEKDIVENKIQLKLAEYVNDYLSDFNKSTELLPTNLGLADLSIVNSIETYNNITLERNRILKNSNKKNPIAINLESKILNLQDNLRESLKKYEASLTVRSQQLELQNDKLNKRIRSVPKQEKLLREIQRQQQIKESLYLYLLQKREETAITLSLTVANSRVIDEAHSNGNVVSPNKKNIFLIAILLGIMIPFVFIFIFKKLNNKLQSTDEIEKSGINVLCEIPQSKVNSDNPIFNSHENSPLAESFRLLRTNMNFILNLNEKNSKVIVVTSTVPNEGKSFISLNLAKSLAILGKKVLVLGMDLRSPTLNKYIGIPNKIGVSNFIINSDLSLEEVLIKNPVDQEFDLISSGDIPPNPAELLLHPRVDHLFTEAMNEYDYVVVDTPPVAIVSDTLLLTKYADMFLYIVREQYTQRKYLKQISQLKEQQRLPNLHVVLNYAKETDAYGYDYYQQAERKKWNLFPKKNKRKS